MNRKTNHIRLELSSKDKIHLEKFCKDLCYPISKIKYRKDRDTNYVSFSSKKMSDDLKKLGFKFNLPDNINEHFLRGFFDGDGSIYSQGKTSVCTSIVGILPHLKSLAKLYPFPVNKFRSVSSSKDIFRIETHGIKSSLMLCDLMYTNASIYLDRKYNKYKHYSYLHNEGSETIIDPSFTKDDGIVHQI